MTLTKAEPAQGKDPETAYLAEFQPKALTDLFVSRDA